MLAMGLFIYAQAPSYEIEIIPNNVRATNVQCIVPGS